VRHRLRAALQEAEAVGVRTLDPPVAEHQRVDRAGALRGGFDPVAQGEGGFLVRDGGVRAAEAEVGEGAHRIGEALRADRQGQVGAVDAVPLEPGAVQQRRAGMRHRPAEDAGELGSA